MKKLETVKNEFITLVLAKGAAKAKIEKLDAQLAKMTVDENYWQLPEYKLRNALMDYVRYLDEKIGVIEHHPLVTKYGMSLDEICCLYNYVSLYGKREEKEILNFTGVVNELKDMINMLVIKDNNN